MPPPAPNVEAASAVGQRILPVSVGQCVPPVCLSAFSNGRESAQFFRSRIQSRLTSATTIQGFEFEQLGNQPRMQRRLIIPDLAVKLVPVQTQGDFGDFKAFIRANLNRGSQRNPTLKEKECTQQKGYGYHWLAARTDSSGYARRADAASKLRRRRVGLRLAKCVHAVRWSDKAILFAKTATCFGVWSTSRAEAANPTNKPFDRPHPFQLFPFS